MDFGINKRYALGMMSGHWETIPSIRSVAGNIGRCPLGQMAIQSPRALLLLCMVHV